MSAVVCTACRPPRMFQTVNGVVQDAVRAGDLPGSARPHEVTLSLIAITVGSHLATAQPDLQMLGAIEDPIRSLRQCQDLICDGWRWSLSTTEWDYRATERRVRDELFPSATWIRDRLSDAATGFPPEVQPPVFDDKRTAAAFTLIAAVSWKDGREDPLGLLGRQAEELADRLRALTGTELVRLYGKPEEEFEVRLKAGKAAALGFTAESVAGGPEGLRRQGVRRSSEG